MKPLRIILHRETDIYFCLALEEYLLTHSEEDVAILWQSHRAVVCGKHQVALRESDWLYCQENGIRIARRISGGGTVFHDQGNLCFTFIRKVEDRQQAIDFRYHTAPIVNWLQAHGIDATHSGRNDILHKGLKISGNAEHLDLRRNKVLHHGTLLYDCDLANLGHAIRGNETCYTDKGVRSVRSKVANIRPDFRPALPEAEVWPDLAAYLVAHLPGAYLAPLQAEELRATAALREEKFCQEAWIFGYSPAYRFQQERQLAAGLLDIKLKVERGYVAEAEIALDGNPCHLAVEAIQGCYHHALPLDDLAVLLPAGLALEDFVRCAY